MYVVLFREYEFSNNWVKDKIFERKYDAIKYIREIIQHYTDTLDEERMLRNKYRIIKLDCVEF